MPAATQSIHWISIYIGADSRVYIYSKNPAQLIQRGKPPYRAIQSRQEREDKAHLPAYTYSGIVRVSIYPYVIMFMQHNHTGLVT